MNTTSPQVIPAPPSLMKALMAGFDAISSHIEVILFPIALDLLLWLGPHLSLAQLGQTLFERAATIPEMSTPEMAEMIRNSQEIWQMAAERFNLLSTLRTFPVGISSLMAGRSPITTPVGPPPVWEIPSLGVVILLWLLLAGLGLVAGTLYFTIVAQAALSGNITWTQAIKAWPWTASQILFLALFWLALLLGVSVPFSCLLPFLVLTGLRLESFVFLLYAGALVWIMLPLFFSPHGVVASGDRMWEAIKKSFRLIRLTLPSTGLLLLLILVLSEGLDVLWKVPDEASWLSLVGIAGHAFVTTGLLAASFVYYRDANRWVERMIQRMQSAR